MLSNIRREVVPQPVVVDAEVAVLWDPQLDGIVLDLYEGQPGAAQAGQHEAGQDDRHGSAGGQAPQPVEESLKLVHQPCASCRRLQLLAGLVTLLGVLLRGQLGGGEVLQGLALVAALHAGPDSLVVWKEDKVITVELESLAKVTITDWLEYTYIVTTRTREGDM